MNEPVEQTAGFKAPVMRRSLWPMLVVGLLTAEAIFCIVTLVIATTNPPIRVDRPLPDISANQKVGP